MSGNERHNDELRRDSGTVLSDDPFVSLFYGLLREVVPAGVLESQVQIVLDERQKGGDVVFTNGYLANYAQNIVKRLRESMGDELAADLPKAEHAQVPQT